MLRILIVVLYSLAFVTSMVAALSTRPPVGQASTSRIHSRTSSSDHHHQLKNRREMLLLGPSAALAILVRNAGAAHADTGTSVRGTQVTPFNSLMFQYRGNGFAGFSAQDLNEPSISYQDFMKRMKAGEVSYVEFRAPDGDVAYATVKGQERPIRIGEGYPIEQHDGYSSPAFAIRAVQNAGVPYKFVVPGLQKYSTS